jgi:2-keto-4-pentenoate hydratase/2-oxohepta-3-ene-1,7-dioic acid hydratase in catechol pathway
MKGDDAIIDLSLAAPGLPTEMAAFLTAGESAMEAARKAAASAKPSLKLQDVHLEAPVMNPRKFLAAGLNYKDHVAESTKGGEEVKLPKYQIWFNKQVTCVHPPFDPVQKPKATNKLDYEGELGFVIGKRCRNVPLERAFEVIAGYMIVDDVSARDWQRKSFTFTLGKSFDTHGPFGPWIVTPDEVGDPQRLGLKTYVNGELRQNSNTEHLLFKIPEMITELSTVFTLEPGDVIATGTPSGVGQSMDPPHFLQDGDVVRIEIEKIGFIEHKIVAET